MSRQEKIKAGLLEIANENYVLRPNGWTYQDCMVDDMWNYLHSQGCVLKVEKELPKMERVILGATWEEHAAINYQSGQWDMVEDGFTAVEPLIKL